MTVEKLIHVVWIGDESQEPRETIASWTAMNPGFRIKVYRNADALSGDWRFADDIAEFHRRGRYSGAADLIRWEALHRFGGIAVDADSLCLRPLPQWLLDCRLAACWDNSVPEGQLLSNGFVLAQKQDPVVGAVIDEIASKPIRYDRWSWSKMGWKPFGEWQTTGPKVFTEVTSRMRPSHFTALPSHFFLPARRDGAVYDGDGPVYAHQLWASTLNKTNIDDLAKEEVRTYKLAS